MTYPKQTPRPPCARQQGFTLLELLVGMFVGLMITGVALGTLMLTRATSSTISEVAQIQQQAAYALQVIGAHIRHGNSYELASVSNAATGNIAHFTFRDYPSGFARFGDGDGNGSGSNPDVLTIGTQTMPFARDCKGTEIEPKHLPVTTSFDLKDNNLRCDTDVNAGKNPQPIIGKTSDQDISVTDFQVRYRNYTINAAGTFTFSMGDTPDNFTNTTGVAAIEICLELQGAEKLPKTTDTYQNCRGEDKEIGEYQRRVFRNVYNVRVKA